MSSSEAQGHPSSLPLMWSCSLGGVESTEVHWSVAAEGPLAHRATKPVPGIKVVWRWHFRQAGASLCFLSPTVPQGYSIRAWQCSEMTEMRVIRSYMPHIYLGLLST